MAQRDQTDVEEFKVELSVKHDQTEDAERSRPAVHGVQEPRPQRSPEARQGKVQSQVQAKRGQKRVVPIVHPY